MKKQIIYSIAILLMGLKLQAQVVLSDKNYIHSTVPQTAMTIAQIEAVNCTNINDVDKTIESVTYFDGLGRPIQQRAIKASKDGKDIVTHIEYDVYGRQDKQYLPFEASNTVGSYKDINVNQDINQYYKDNYTDDFPGITNTNLGEVNAYSESIFDKSPLNRVIKIGAPGTAWKANPNSDADHAIKTDWYTNKVNEVIYFKVDFANPNDTEAPSLVKDGFYGANQLYITITQDENWTPAAGNNHTTKEYKDKQGRIVLKRTFNAGSAHDTHYVYDRFGNLTYVIPPKVDTSTTSISAIELTELCYQYKYDYRNRLIEKKIPGKGKEYIVYNKLDQPIMTQDTNLKATNAWLYTKYDAFGRVAYTGKITDPKDRAALQTEATAYSDALWVDRIAPVLVDGVQLYYNDGGYPKVTNATLLTINYYGDYTVLGSEDTFFNAPATIYGVTPRAQTKSLPVVSKVRVLETLDWITTVTYYDTKSRPIYVASKNEYLNTTDIIETKLDFVGKVEETTTTHIKDSHAAIVTIDSFMYDHMGRVLNQTQKINTQDPEVIAANTYDALGQLVSKKVGNGLQDIHYKYNVRGWLKGINDVNNLGNDLFAFGINYNTPQLGATPLFNGNIAETHWKTQSVNPNPPNNPVSTSYVYSYDALNRIVSATDNTGNYSISNITYDKVGNILSLNRKGHINAAATDFGDMDILSYTYDSGNKLMKVSDAAPIDQFGFKDDAVNTTADTSNDYVYDTNGNMTEDQNKGITGITYNHLNLPQTVTVNNTDHNGNINYIYDATGAKLKKIATEGSSLIETEYAGNYVYKNGNLEFFNTSEGYVEQHSDGFKYIYQYKDHLGNIRLSYNKGGNKTFLNDTFDSSTDGWGGGGVSATNGRLGVKVRYMYSGTNKKITQSFSAGETVKIRLKLDANGKGYKMRVLVNEIDATNKSTGWYSAGDAGEGNFEATYQIKQDASKLNIKLGLTSSIAAEEEIYLDDISVVQETEEGIIVQEEKNYYPFGLQHRGYNFAVNGRKHNYGFNGVEHNESLGLDLYEMDLRKYDPAIARWTGIDPVTHFSQSTYTAFDNNPVVWADPSGADGEHYNWDTKRYEDDQGNEVSFETALASVSGPNDHIKINTKTKKAEVFADDNDYDTIETDGEISYSPNGKTRSRLESEGYSIRDIEGVGMGAVDNSILILSSEAVFAWTLRGIKGAWAAWAARGTTTVTAKSSSNFLKLLKPLDEFDEAVTLFRGTTGSEASSASIFLTDNAAVAATYIKNGGQVASYRISQFAIKQLEQSGTLNLLKGIHNRTGQISTEYQFIGKELVNAINQLAK
ncbi:DUF6443 domain-containing protein [Aquimarina macrocephali]|uniref:DUF6443 domain-containing protein n=1 Tax=Aquimarina macrocephali TaxID=666563 RepID=UPI0009FD1B0A|nr:DUF6443 domain-containing protein [Aquimarina macrocephali]